MVCRPFAFSGGKRQKKKKKITSDRSCLLGDTDVQDCMNVNRRSRAFFETFDLG